MNEPRPNIKDAPSLIVQAISELRHLVSAEIRLAKEEVSQNVARAGFGAAMVVVAALLALTAFHALAVLGGIALHASGFSILVSASIVTAVLIALAVICGLIGKAKLSSDALKPNKTLKNVKSDIATVKEATRV